MVHIFSANKHIHSVLNALRIYLLTAAGEQLRSQMPNEWRTKAGGRPVYCVQLRMWQDDVSGNVSKQWNKHWLCCMTHAGLPRKLLVQEYFTRFICCSPFASVLEQSTCIKEAIQCAPIYSPLSSTIAYSFSQKKSRRCDRV